MSAPDPLVIQVKSQSPGIPGWHPSLGGLLAWAGAYLLQVSAGPAPPIGCHRGDRKGFVSSLCNWMKVQGEEGWTEHPLHGHVTLLDQVSGSAWAGVVQHGVCPSPSHPELFDSSVGDCPAFHCTRYWGYEACGNKASLLCRPVPQPQPEPA